MASRSAQKRHRYFVDKNGRMGIYSHDMPERECVEYAYGRGPYPRDTASCAEMPKHDFDAAFAMQREKMWDAAIRLERTRLSVARRFCRGSGLDALRLDAEELASTVGLTAACYAFVTWDIKKASLETYARRVLMHAYAREANRRQREVSGPAMQEVLGAEHDDAQDVAYGLETREQLSNLGLTDDELKLLLARYDTGMSLDDLRFELGVKSRETVRTKINRLLEQCRSKTQDT